MLNFILLSLILVILILVVIRLAVNIGYQPGTTPTQLPSCPSTAPIPCPGTNMMDSQCCQKLENCYGDGKCCQSPNKVCRMTNSTKSSCCTPDQSCDTMSGKCIDSK
jgi:hypothetical protein